MNATDHGSLTASDSSEDNADYAALYFLEKATSVLPETYVKAPTHRNFDGKIVQSCPQISPK